MRGGAGDRWAVPVALAVAVLALACDTGGDPLPEDARVRVDTVDGVPHVVSGNRGAWVRGGAWSVADSGVVIGALDGPEEYTFGQVNGVVVGEDGHIYVGDGHALEVRVFDRDGRFVRRFGQEGEGPGEFTNISGLARAPEGIAVLDGRQARVTVFGPDGDVARTFRVRRPYMILNQFAVMAFDGEGRFYDRTRLDARPPADSLAVLSYAPDGTPLDTALLAVLESDDLVVERDGLPIMSFTRPFAPRPSTALGPDGQIYFARGDRYRIAVLDAAGDTLRVLRRDLQPRPVTEAERDSALAIIEARYQEVAGSGAPRGVRIPDRKAMIADLRVDRAGNLWVAAVSEPGWRRAEWAVHAPDGRYLGPLTTPLMAVTDIGDDYVAGVEWDELGVQRVRVLHLEK